MAVHVMRGHGKPYGYVRPLDCAGCTERDRRARRCAKWVSSETRREWEADKGVKFDDPSNERLCIKRQVEFAAPDLLEMIGDHRMFSEHGWSKVEPHGVINAQPAKWVEAMRHCDVIHSDITNAKRVKS